MIKHAIGISILTVVVILAGIIGIYIAGSPMENRSVRYDEIRIRDLNNIQTAVNSYYQDNYQLPSAINQLLGNRIKTGLPYLKKEPKDPKSKVNYSYRIVTTTNYELCATFDTSSENIQQRKTGISESLSDYSSYYGEEQSHPKGKYCFTKTPPAYLQRQSTPTRELNYEDLSPQATPSAF